jgi:hypothetical protein
MSVITAMAHNLRPELHARGIRSAAPTARRSARILNFGGNLPLNVSVT